MKKVTADGSPLSVNSGQVGLSKAQAAVRLHALRLVGKLDREGNGVYEVVAPIQFKAGETFGFDGEVPKGGGALRDPEAEALAKMELEDRVRVEVRAELEVKIRAELEAVIRAELTKELGKVGTGG